MMNNRNYITSIVINWRDYDKITLERLVNLHTGIQEASQRERWISMLNGLIEDIREEIEYIKEDED